MRSSITAVRFYRTKSLRALIIGGVGICRIPKFGISDWGSSGILGQMVEQPPVQADPQSMHVPHEFDDTGTIALSQNKLTCPSSNASSSRKQ